MSEAIERIELILKSEFSMQNFIELCKEIFDDLSLNPQNIKQKVYSNFSSHIDNYSHVGNYNSPDGKSIAIFAVQLKAASYVENSRSTQRSFARDLIDSGNCDAAIVAFYTPNDSKWRLSFVRLDYEMKVDNGKLKTSENLTPAKRYSFLVGKDEPCHTAISRLRKFIIDQNYNPSLDEIEEAFSVEKVTKEFFNLYCEKFYQLQEYLESNQDFKDESTRCGFTSEQFAKKLMGQIVFLYFLQKKGWLGVKVWYPNLTEKEYNNIFYTSGGQGRIIKEHLPKLYVKANDEYKLNSKVLDIIPDADEEVIANHMPVKMTWGDGSKKFLRTIFDWSQKHGGHFYEAYLEPLFYNTLNRNRGELGYCPELHCRIPFLSGGLFEPIDNYDWKSNNFDIPDEIFSNKKDDSDREGTGILDIFDRYNFTISEDEPMEREVAIDPEMLGKVFENLLEIKDRKSKGAFYTPREIVHYMCQESLINYLTETLKVSEEAVRDFILYGDFIKDEDTKKDKKKGNEEMYISEELFKVDAEGKIIVDRLKDMDIALQNVRVADPAVGSGAFPLGMLNEIVRARQNISAYMAISMNAHQTRMMYMFDRSPRTLKYETIRNCIFAADIEPSAVDIAQLRLWLSLVIDDEINPDAQSELEGHRNPLPLPNLECNILCGNSLIDEFEGVKLVEGSTVLGTNTASQISMAQERFDSIIQKLIETQEELFRCDDTEKKKELLNRIKDLKDAIIMSQLDGLDDEQKIRYELTKHMASKPYVLWQLDFARVFKEKGGFDIVIGNPPYVQLQKFRGTPTQDMLKKQRYITYHNKGDMYCLFYEKGISLCKTNGVECLITSNKWMRADYGKDLRNYFLNYNPLLLVDLGSNIFETATVDTNILLIKKETNRDTLRVSKYDDKGISLQQFVCDNSRHFKYNIDSAWFFGEQGIDSIKNKAEKNGKVLANWGIDIRCGFKTGLNEAFIISNELKEELCEKDANSIDVIKKNLRGKDVRRYRAAWDNLWIIVAYNGFYKVAKEKYPAIYEHLCTFENQLKERGQCKYSRNNANGTDYIGQHHWLELDNNPRKDILDVFNNREKVLFSDISQEPPFFYDTNQYFSQETVFAITGNHLLYLTGMLNSRCVNYIYSTFYAGGGLGEHAVRYKKKFLEKLPIPIPTVYEENEISDLVLKIQEAKSMEGEIDISLLENRIEEIACKLYQLSENETRIIYGN